MLSSSANWMLGLSAPFLIYEMTDSAVWLGITAIASNAPSLIASPLGGVWADRYSKRRVLILSLALQFLVAVGLFYTSREDLLTPVRLVALSALMGFASSTHLSAYQAFVAEIVPNRQIAAAYRLNAIQFNVSRAVGPAVAGFVLAQWGPTTAFGVNAVAYLPLAVVLILLKPRVLERAPANSILSDLAAAARIAWQDQCLRRALATTTVTATFGMGIHPLIAGLAKDIFHVDEQGLGILVSSIGVTSVITALIMVVIADRFPRSKVIQIGLFLYGFGTIVVASSNVFAIGMLGFAITGVAHVLVNVSVTTSVQIHVPEAFRGRVTSFQMMGIILSMPVGAQIGGLVGEHIGLSSVLALYGCALFVYVAFARWRLDGLSDLD